GQCRVGVRCGNDLVELGARQGGRRRFATPEDYGEYPESVCRRPAAQSAVIDSTESRACCESLECPRRRRRAQDVSQGTGSNTTRGGEEPFNLRTFQRTNQWETDAPGPQGSSLPGILCDLSGFCVERRRCSSTRSSYLSRIVGRF